MTAQASGTDARRRPPVVSFTVFELRRVLRTASFLIWTLAFPAVFYLASYGNPTNNNAGNTRSWGTPWPVYFIVSMCAWAAIAAAFNAGGGAPGRRADQRLDPAAAPDTASVLGLRGGQDLCRGGPGSCRRGGSRARGRECRAP